MTAEIIRGILIPFLGTSLGAACVFFMKNEFHISVRRALIGFAAGVMTAASVWSLLIPSMEQSADMGKAAWIPAAAGFMLGIAFLLSPFGLQAVAGAVITGLDSLNLSLRQFITS